MRLVKRSAWGFAALLALAAGGAIALILIVGGVGQSAIEGWVASQLKAIARDTLKPELDFDTLDYRAPSTVMLTGVRLVANDPGRPGERVTIIQARRITIELAELPREGQPLRFDAITLDDATVRLVDQQQGGFVGFDDLLVEGVWESGTRLSELLQVNAIVINNGAIEYDSKEPDTQPMRFDDIDTTVRITPGERGYRLDLDLGKQGVFDASLDGVLDPDKMSLAIETLFLNLDMSRQTDRYLPPQAQAFVKAHDLVGRVRLEVDGEVNLEDAAASAGKLKLRLQDAHAFIEGYRVPIRELTVDVSLADRVARHKLAGSVMGGSLWSEGTLGLDDTLPAAFTLGGDGLDLEALSAVEPGAEAMPYAGQVELRVDAKAPLMQMDHRLVGEGTITVTQGRLARVPLIADLVDYLESSGSVKRDEGGPAGSDTAEVAFELRGDHAFLSKAKVIGTWFAIRGEGTVHFDQRLAMNVNAGPLAKAQEVTGAFGRAFGRVTDGLITYRVQGPFDDLSIRPVPLGGLIGAPGEGD